MGENKTLAGCYGKGYFGSSCFTQGNEFRRVAAHMASSYNLSINSKISATSLVECTSVRKISIRIRSFWETVYGNNLGFYDQWRNLVCPHASICFEKSHGVKGTLQAFTGFGSEPWERSGGFSAGRQMQNCHGKIITENLCVLVYKLKGWSQRQLLLISDGSELTIQSVRHPLLISITQNSHAGSSDAGALAHVLVPASNRVHALSFI